MELKKSSYLHGKEGSLLSVTEREKHLFVTTFSGSF